MSYLNPQTLAYYQHLPQTQRFDLSGLTMRQVGAATKVYREDCGLENPDAQAIEFYALNHLVALLKTEFTKNEILPEWGQQILTAYLHTLRKQASRMTHYMLSICTRELRYLPNKSVLGDYAHPPELKNWIENVICKSNEELAPIAFMENSLEFSIVQYLDLVSKVFHNTSATWSSSIGGPKWGEVTDTVLNFFKGNISQEVLVDTGYTLAHNNGPVFNKGMMYEHYSGAFNQILDVQAAGMMPDLLLDPRKSVRKLVPTTSDMTQVRELVTLMAPRFAGMVNWLNVKDKNGKIYSAFHHFLEGETKTVKPVKTPTKHAVPPNVKAVFGAKAKYVGTYQVSHEDTVAVYARN